LRFFHFALFIIRIYEVLLTAEGTGCRSNAKVHAYPTLS
jgi:hypothetical protein